MRGFKLDALQGAELCKAFIDNGWTKAQVQKLLTSDGKDLLHNMKWAMRGLYMITSDPTITTPSEFSEPMSSRSMTKIGVILTELEYTETDFNQLVQYTTLKYLRAVLQDEGEILDYYLVIDTDDMDPVMEHIARTTEKDMVLVKNNSLGCIVWSRDCCRFLNNREMPRPDYGQVINIERLSETEYLELIRPTCEHFDRQQVLPLSVWHKLLRHAYLVPPRWMRARYLVFGGSLFAEKSTCYRKRVYAAIELRQYGLRKLGFFPPYHLREYHVGVPRLK